MLLRPDISFVTDKQRKGGWQSKQKTVSHRPPYGEMPEWLNGAVSKTVVGYVHPGFESLSLRQFSKPGSGRAFANKRFW